MRTVMICSSVIAALGLMSQAAMAQLVPSLSEMTQMSSNTSVLQAQPSDLQGAPTLNTTNAGTQHTAILGYNRGKTNISLSTGAPDSAYVGNSAHLQLQQE